MTDQATNTTDPAGTTAPDGTAGPAGMRTMRTARILAVAAALAAALAGCSSGPQANDTRTGPAKSQAAQASRAGQPRQAPWDGRLPATGYPGAAALVSKAAASVPARTILPPVSDPHSDTPRYWVDNCLDSPDAAAEKVCVYGETKNPVLTVAMVGGSIDGSWFPALLQLAERRHWKLVTDLHGTCEWTAAMLVLPSGDKYTACHAWGQAVLKDLETKIKPAVVITSGLPERGTADSPAPGSAGSMASIGAGMAKYWTELEKHGISVVAMRETPIMNFQVGACVARYGRTSPRCVVPAAKAIIADPPTVRASRDTGGKVPVIDMNRFICGPQECAPVVGNILVYLDGRHLTASYARSMTSYLEPLLLRAAPVLAR